MNRNIATYYNDRAAEYDKVYQISEEQDDLLKAIIIFQNLFANKSVLEIACGTGYWTEQISKTANSIFATDINKSVVDMAKKRIFTNNVDFEVVDIYKFETDKRFDGIFGGFIWSHILIQDLDNLLYSLKNLLKENAVIAFIDSKPVHGSIHDKLQITRTDKIGNTFQTRLLENGSIHEVLKNFPSTHFIEDKLTQIGTDIKILELEHYWIATCIKK